MHVLGVGWRQYAHNNTAIGTGMLSTFSNGQNWVVQGRPGAGSTSTAPIYVSYPVKIACSGGNCGQLKFRYIIIDNVQGDAGEDAISIAGGLVSIEHVSVVNNVGNVGIYAVEGTTHIHHTPAIAVFLSLHSVIACICRSLRKRPRIFSPASSPAN